MAQMEYEPVTLSTLGEGAAEELFGRVWERVLENILDPNFPASAQRKVTLVITIKPNEDRTLGAMEIEADAKLPTGIGASSMCHIGRQGGKATAVQSKSRQLQMDWDKDSKIREIRPAEGAAPAQTEGD